MVDYNYLFFHCSFCGNVLKTPKTYAGTQGCCPFCEHINNAPEDQNIEIKIGVDKNDFFGRN